MTDTIQKVEDLLERVGKFQAAVKKLKTASVSRTPLKAEAKSIYRAWLPMLGEIELQSSIPKDGLEALRQGMERLRTLADGNNPKKTYLAILKTIFSTAETEVLHTLIKHSGFKILANSVGTLFASVTDANLKTYLDEATTCATHNCFRAAVVLSWCATAHRIQQKLLSLGLPRVESEFDKMRLDQGILFRSFNRSYKFASHPDVEEVSDAHLILLCRFLGWIDDSQYKQLRGTLDLRNGCAHPGSYQPDAIKLQVYFSDLVQLVLANTAFS